MRTIELNGPAAHDGLTMSVPDDLVAVVAFTYDGNAGLHASLAVTLPGAIPAATIAKMLRDMTRMLDGLPDGTTL